MLEDVFAKWLISRGVAEISQKLFPSGAVQIDRNRKQVRRRLIMKYLRYLALLGLLMLPLAYSQAEVRVGVGIGFGPGYYVAGPPACAYGYYPYYPYACAPYGYYGPSWFVNGVFIGAGPWYHGWG